MEKMVYALLFLALLFVFSMAAGLSFLTVTGTSMNPGITDKDIVVIAPVDPDLLRVGDVITYAQEIEGKNFTFTHRIVSINNGTIKTKGDSMSHEDSYEVRGEEVRGILVGTIPYVGLLSKLAHTPLGYLTLILAPAVLLIIMQIGKILGGAI